MRIVSRLSPSSVRASFRFCFMKTPIEILICDEGEFLLRYVT